jgi:hypothetical protein
MPPRVAIGFIPGRRSGGWCSQDFASDRSAAMPASEFFDEREWTTDTSPLPTERDFNPLSDTTDAKCAWENFGRLSRVKAYERFLEHPLNFQEDFMFMGGVAFAYYYPVIERYLYDASEELANDGDDREAWILAKAIQNQFAGQGLSHVRHLAPRILALAQYVRNNLPLYDCELDGRQRIDDAWTELESHIKSISKE